MSCLCVFLVQFYHHSDSIVCICNCILTTLLVREKKEDFQVEIKSYRKILNLSKNVIDSEEEDIDLNIADIPDKFYRPRKLFKGINASLLNSFHYEN